MLTCWRFYYLQLSFTRVVIAYATCRRIELLDFMNRIVASIPSGKSMLFNKSQHPHAQAGSLAQASSERALPLHADALPGSTRSIWFSILADQSLAGASFHSVTELRVHTDDFIEAYNARAKPFARTKSEVHQKRLKARFADQ